MEGSKRSCVYEAPQIRCAPFRGVMPHYGELGLRRLNHGGGLRFLGGSAAERAADITHAIAIRSLAERRPQIAGLLFSRSGVRRF